MFFRQLPKIYQAFLMSATLGEDVLSLKKLVLHNAVSVLLNFMVVQCKTCSTNVMQLINYVISNLTTVLSVIIFFSF